jgi:hypothetical protein
MVFGVLLSLCATHTFALSKPLFLSHYLDNPALGRNLSLVSSIPYPAPSHSGYFTVGEGRNTFVWLFENQAHNANAPSIMWLQGDAVRFNGEHH